MTIIFLSRKVLGVEGLGSISIIFLERRFEEGNALHSAKREIPNADSSLRRTATWNAKKGF